MFCLDHTIGSQKLTDISETDLRNIFQDTCKTLGIHRGVNILKYKFRYCRIYGERGKRSQTTRCARGVPTGAENCHSKKNVFTEIGESQEQGGIAS